MANIDDAFRVEKLSIDDIVLITCGASDPSTGGGYEAPAGSIYLQTTGSLYRKIGSLATDWSSTMPSAHELSSIVVTTAYAADDKILIFVNTTSNAVTITLPAAADFAHKFFHVKWIAGSSRYKVTVNAQSGEYIDDESSVILGLLYDSLNMVSNGTSWWII